MIELQKTGLNWKSILFSIFLLLVVAVGIVYVRRPQDIRNKAALSGAVLSMNPSSTSKAAGSTFPVAVILNAGPYSVTGAEIHVQYNPAVLEITGFTPGKPLPVVLTQPAISSGNASVTLGAQPNAYLKGSDIVGTFTVKALTNKPAAITFTTDTMVSALEKTTNALVSSSGVSVNGTPPSPMPVKCDGPDGSQCAMGICPQPTCIAGQPCPRIACKLQTGVCSAGICRAPVQCNGSNNGSYCKRCKPCTSDVCPLVCLEEIATCQNGQCSGAPIAVTPTPTPPVGCYYQQVQCVNAPCNPVLVCPTPGASSCTYARNGAACTIGSCPTCVPGRACPAIACRLQSGTCQNGQCVPGCTPPPAECVDANGGLSLCDPRPGVTWCRPTAIPTPTPHNWCPGPNGTTCAWDCNTCNLAGGCTRMKCPAVTGTCRNNTCIKPTATPTPTPPPGCFYRQVQCIQAPCNPILVCPTKTPTPTVSPTPIISGSQVIDIRIKLAGVTDGSANGAKVGIKFVKLGGETLQLSSALPLVHIGNGVYKAEATLSNTLPFGTKFRIKVKGEKHLTSEFCYQVGQTGPCKDNEYITMPNFIAQTYGFDFTGIPLRPGDVPPQDGKVDATDFTAIKSLMSKLCADLTAQDKLKADLDYNGCVTVKDIFLIRQTLETRYDE